MIEPADLWADPLALMTSAKSLTFEPIDIRRMLDLNAQWHSVLPELRIGVARWGDLVLPVGVGDGSGGIYAVALVTRPIAANRLRWPLEHLAELRRLAVAPYAPKFTATRSLRIVREELKRFDPLVCTLVSYQATDVHSGTIYKADNWVCDGSGGYVSWADHGDGTRQSHRPQQNNSVKLRWRYPLRRCGCLTVPE